MVVAEVEAGEAGEVAEVLEGVDLGPLMALEHEGTMFVRVSLARLLAVASDEASLALLERLALGGEHPVAVAALNSIRLRADLRSRSS